MSKYTTEVRFICENYAGLSESKGQASVNEIIQKACPKVFDFSFPIYDEGYRNVLESKILKHYYTREICAETVGLWKLWLDTKLNEIMPYYNQLYKSTTLEFNPFYDFDYTTTSNRDIGQDETSSNKGSNKNSSSIEQNGTTKNVDKYSDTPQGGLQNVESGTYLTSATIDDGTTHSTGTGSSSGESTNDGTRKFQSTDEYLEHVAGKKGGQSYSSLLQEYRKSFLNIDMMIIDDLSDLFFNLW